MTREDIEKAAQECAERLASIAYSGGGHIGQDDLETSFKDGVEWFINHLFHNLFAYHHMKYTNPFHKLEHSFYLK